MEHVGRAHEPRPRRAPATAATPPRRRSSSPTRSGSRRSAATSASPPSASRGSAPSSATGGDAAQAARLFGACDGAARVDRRDADADRGRAERAVRARRCARASATSASRAEWAAGRAEAPGEAIELALVAARPAASRRSPSASSFAELRRPLDSAPMAATDEASEQHWYTGLHSTRPLQLLVLALVAAVVAPIIGAHYYTGEIMWPLVIGGYSGAALAFTAALFWDRHSRLQDEVRQTEADRRRDAGAAAAGAGAPRRRGQAAVRRARGRARRGSRRASTARSASRPTTSISSRICRPARGPRRAVRSR